MQKSKWITLGGLTGVSRILGLLRDVICAYFFGANQDFDAFIVAFQIPNFMRRLFAEGAFTQAFVPIYNDLSSKDQKVFAGLTLTLIVLFTGSLVALTIMYTKGIILLYAPGFVSKHQEQLANTIAMLKWTMPYITMISIVSMCAGIQNSHNKFNLTGMIPIVLNLCLILATLNSKQDVFILAKAVFAAGLLQAGIMLTSTIKYIGSLNLDLTNKNIKQLYKLMLIGSLTAIISQFSTMLDTFLASWLEAGSVSWMYYAQRLVYLPIGMIAVAISTVLVPALTKVKADKVKFARRMQWGLDLIWLIAWPAAIGLIVMAPTIVDIFFLHGKFNERSAIITCSIIRVLALGLPAFMLNKIFLAGLYAQKRLKEPFLFVCLSLFTNLLVAIILIKPCAQIGIALGTVTSAWLQTILLSKKFTNRFFEVIAPISACIMALTIILVLKTTHLNGILNLIVGLSLGIGIFELCLKACNKSLFRELKLSKESI